MRQDNNTNRIGLSLAITTICIFGFTVAGGMEVIPGHPPEVDHHHPHNSRHGTIPPDESRFYTNRTSDVVLPLPEEDDAFFFVVFGDRTGGPADGVKVLAQAVNDVNLIEPDLVMTVGDLVEGYNERDLWLTQMREYRGIMNHLLCPWFPVAGNHDIYWYGPNKPAEEHETDYEMHFGPLWYAFEHKNSWFISLYSDEANPSTGERNFNKPECQIMSDAQFNWLKETLGKAKDAEHVFLFLHHPRWLGGKYGDDWEKVHAELVKAGNVSAVFAGHIHYMRYDGPRDGIEYVTLATVGGAQSGRVPEAGYLHHYNIVTVRKDQIAMGSLPVGEMMDVRAISGDVSKETGILSRLQPRIAERLVLEIDGSADGRIHAMVSNPVTRPIEVSIWPNSEDSRWRFTPSHNHRVIEPGDSVEFVFDVSRKADSFDETFHIADILLQTDYLAEGARYSIPEKKKNMPLKANIPAPAVPKQESVLAVDGWGDSLKVPSDLLQLPDGPFTLECWFNAKSYGERTGLLCKTESSEYGFFVNRGELSFIVNLDGKYVDANSTTPVLKTDTWHHVAGVFDGREIRLYLDGAKLHSVRCEGKRTLNDLPLIVGADVDYAGRPTSYFNGMIDGVRLSTIARYTGQNIEPVRRLENDEHTALLLNMDGRVGAWMFDESSSGAHPEFTGNAKAVLLDD